MIRTITPVATGPLQVNTLFVPLAENAVLVVDPAACAASGDETRITDFLRRGGLRPAGILLTHGHFDHITGLRILKDAYPDCPIAVHEADAKMAGTDAAQIQKESLTRLGLPELTAALENLPPADIPLRGGEMLEAVFQAETSAAVRTALSEWRVIHTPGHSPGSVCFFNARKKELVSGDTVFYQAYGRTDLEGGSRAQMRESLDNLKENLPPDTLVFPGHDQYGFPLYATL